MRKATILSFLVGFLFLATVSSSVQSMTFRTLHQERSLTEVKDQYVVGNYRQEGNLAASAKAAVKPAPSISLPVRKVGNDTYVVESSPVRANKMMALASQEYDFVYPVYLDPQTKGKIYPRPELIVQLRAGASAEAFAARNSLLFIRPVRLAVDQYLFQIDSSLSPFDVSNRLWSDQDVVWSNPNVVHQVKLNFRPNDEYYPMQWHLKNTGQGGGVSGADIHAEEAWDLVQPNQNLVVAVVDNGVEVGHPDLNIYTNIVEANGQTGVDDDNNGFIDDIHGWDFIQNDNDTQADPLGDHGTSVAGVAAAIGNNGIGVTGAAYGVQVLPVTILGIYEGEDANAEALAVAEGIRYAAKYADIHNNSWGGPVTDVEMDALTFATSDQAKRGEKGVPVLFAAGNGAVESVFFSLDYAMDLPAGDHEVRFVYEKDANGSFGEDRVVVRYASLLLPSSGETTFSMPFSGQSANSRFYVFEMLDVTPGPHTLVFEYRKDESVSDGEDMVVIEDVFVNFNEDLSDYITLIGFDGNLDEGVSLEGDVPFTLEEGEFYPHLQSGAIGDNESSRVVWNFDVPEGTDAIYLELYFRASTEEGGDFFHVYLDEEEMVGEYTASPDFPSISLFSSFSGLHESAVMGGDKLFSVIEDDVLEQQLISGDIGDNQSSEIIFPITLEEDGSVSLSVEFHSETEKDKDFFRIFVNDEEVEGTFGEDGSSFAFAMPFSGAAPENAIPISGINQHPNIINIGSSNDSDERSSYSQWGPELLFLAPSDGGFSSIVTTTYRQLDPESGLAVISEGYLSDFGGTSSACPLASGVFAMMMSAYPDITVEQMVEIAKETSVKIGSRPYDSNGFNEEYGYGKLDMAAAVRKALDLRGTDVNNWSVY